MPTASNPLKVAAGWLDAFPDSPGFIKQHFGKTWQQGLAFLLAALVLRCATFGNPNLHIDDAFYLFVGQEMHLGAWPYVDIWDRKPLGLFAIYYLAAFLPDPVIAYQVMAALFAAGTAMAINRIAARETHPQGGLLAGLCYLFVLPLMQGWGGQGPVFYNLFVALAAMLVLRDREGLGRGSAGWRTFAAMGLMGLALTIKQTVIFEAVFLGLYALWWMRPANARQWGQVVLWLVLGAAPMAAIALCYLAAGHWELFWHAMVGANLDKDRLPVSQVLLNTLRMVLRLYPLWLLAICGIVAASPPWRRFLIGWLVAAFLGVAVVPNFYGHYALPLMVPLCVAAATILQRRDVGVFALAMVAAFSAVLFNPFDFAETRNSRRSMEAMATAIAAHDSGGGLFIPDGPAYLYTMAGKRPLAPIAFPPHFNEWIERNSSPYDIDQTVARILARRPGVIVISVFRRNDLTNDHTRQAALHYAQSRCRLVDAQTAYEIDNRLLIAIYGDCKR